MSSFITGLIAFAATFGGALVGLRLAHVLPRERIGPEARSAISSAMGVIGTLVALVLGLLITQVSNTYAQRGAAIAALAGSIVRLDLALADYGPDADRARDGLRDYTVNKLDELRHGASLQVYGVSEPLARLDRLGGEVDSLAPKTVGQRYDRQLALDILKTINEQRWQIVVLSHTELPPSFPTLIILWLALLFLGYGITTPPNDVVIAIFCLCALAVTSSLYAVVSLSARSAVPSPALAAFQQTLDTLTAAGKSR